ncbi:hypothetical protein V1504DRAFT_494617 [Lipomyces starkeyi]
MTAISSLSPPLRRVVALVVIVLFVGTLIYFRDLSASTLVKGLDPPNHRKAAQLSAKDLLESPIAKNYEFVPKLIHQSWSTHWQWVLWTDEDNLNLVKKYFPWFLEYYQKLPGEIYRADLVRNMYMYLYGGMYADLDIECLRPANELFETYNITTVPYKSTYDGSHHRSSNTKQERKAFFGRMGTNDTFNHSMPNAWMASTPGHPFFLLSLDSVIEKLKGEIHGKITAEHLTDSDELDQRMNKNPIVDVFGPQDRLKHTVEVLPWWNVYPYSWDRDGSAFKEICSVNSEQYDRERCKLNIATDHWGSYFITYWSHSWSRSGHNENNMKNIAD